MDNWFKKISESLIANKEFNISEVQEIKLIKAFEGYGKYEDSLSKILEQGNYIQIEEVNNPEQEFDDITIISFKDQRGQLYYGLVYDSDELWQDPVVTKIFPKGK